MVQMELEKFPQYLVQLRNFIEKTCGIDDESWEELKEIMILYRVSKNVQLVSHSERETCIRFLGRGIFKCEDEHNGQRFVHDFRVAPVIVSETVSFFNGVPTTISITTCTECDIIVLPREPFLKLAYSNFKIAEFSIKGTANYLAKVRYNYALLRSLTAEDRYRTFLRDFANVALEVKLEDIASYLNVKQATLSRIRKSIVWDEEDKDLKALSNELEVVHGGRVSLRS